MNAYEEIENDNSKIPSPDPNREHVALKQFYEFGVLNLWGNVLPKHLIALESIFNKNDSIHKGNTNEDPSL